MGTSQTAGEAVSKGDALALYWDAVAGGMRVRKAQSNSASYDLRAVYGLAGANTLSGGLVPVGLSLGAVVEGNFDTPLGGGDLGKVVFLSSTLGLFTVTPPLPPGQDVFRVGILNAISGGFGKFAFQPQFVVRFP